MKKEKLLKLIEMQKARSCYMKGVKEYAYIIIESLEDINDFYYCNNLKKTLLNGADNWKDYSYNACALIYDNDIAAALCTPSELKKYNNGEKQPGKNKTWLDIQAGALRNAYSIIESILYTDIVRQCKNIIKTTGGYREKSIFKKQCDYTVEQFDQDYYIIKVSNGERFCEVDLKSGLIVG